MQSSNRRADVTGRQRSHRYRSSPALRPAPPRILPHSSVTRRPSSSLLARSSSPSRRTSSPRRGRNGFPLIESRLGTFDSRINISSLVLTQDSQLRPIDRGFHDQITGAEGRARQAKRIQGVDWLSFIRGLTFALEELDTVSLLHKYIMVIFSRYSGTSGQTTEAPFCKAID